ncbi:MAG: choice-of-anchor U domain-containing protein [bacterium]
MGKYIPVLRVLAATIVATCTLGASTASALVGQHHFTNVETGDVYLGGDYIELGISKTGSFGTTCGLELPPGFYGTIFGSNVYQCSSYSVGMSTNPAGFGVDPDLRMDYFLPELPEERWAVGYKVEGTPTIGSNNLLFPLPIDPNCDNPFCETAPRIDIPNNIVTDESSGDELKATSVGTLNETLKTTQEVTFSRADKYFRNKVTLKNDGATPIDSVRFMRSFDPDNTVFQGGNYTTHNYIPFTHEAGDGKAVVVADTNLPDAIDPVKAINGSDSPILFYSNDPRARVSTFGFSNTDPYDPLAYDEALPKGTEVNADQAITVTFDVGSLAPGASQEVIYYTSLDNRDFTEAVNIINNTDNDNVSKPAEDNAPNNGDGNNDGTPDGVQNNVTSYVGVDEGHYNTLVSDCANNTSVHVDPESLSLKDVAFDYPAGLVTFRLTGCTVGGEAHVTQYYYGDYTNRSFILRKWDGTSYTTVPDATLTQTTIGDQKVMKVQYTILDGGPFDEDHVADGAISDPTGPAVNAIAVPNTGFGSGR